MSPEQGHGSPLDERSDLYSLGIIFYEMLTRQKPYIAQTPMAVIYMHANAPIPLLPRGAAQISAAAEQAAREGSGVHRLRLGESRCWRRSRS